MGCEAVGQFMATVLIEATLCSLKQQSFETPNSNSELSKLLLKVLSVGYCVCRAGVNREVYLRTLLSGLKVTHYTLNV